MGVRIRSCPGPVERQTMQPARVERTIAGRTLSFETGVVARQAAGSVLARMGDTVVLSAITVANPREGIDFFPLTVEYREKVYSAGKFPGGFIKREGRPTNKEILTCRLIDRPIRPLLSRGIQQRDPGLRDRALGRQGERAGRPRDERLVRRDDARAASRSRAPSRPCASPASAASSSPSRARSS